MDETATHKSFPFLSLPAELREKVYSHLFVRHRILISYDQSLPSRHAESTKPKTTPKGLIAITKLPKPNESSTRFELPTPYATATTASILLTSLQLHQEASYILYAHNTFDFTTMPAVRSFLQLIGPRNRSLLTHVRLSSWNRLGWKLALEALADVRVRELGIAVWKFDTYEAQWDGFLRELSGGLGGQMGNVRFFVGGGEVWERGRGNILGSEEVEVLGRRGLEGTSSAQSW